MTTLLTLGGGVECRQCNAKLKRSQQRCKAPAIRGKIHAVFMAAGLPVPRLPKAKLSDGHFTSKPLQDNVDFFLGGMLAGRFTTDILNRLFSIGHAHSETLLLS